MREDLGWGIKRVQLGKAGIVEEWFSANGGRWIPSGRAATIYEDPETAGKVAASVGGAPFMLYRNVEEPQVEEPTEGRRYGG